MVRNREREEIEKEKNAESGYSEAEQAKDIEARSGDLHALKRSSTSINTAFDKDDHAKEYRKVTEELGKLIEHYVKLVEDDLHHAQKMLDEIHKQQKLQHELFEKITGKK